MKSFQLLDSRLQAGSAVKGLPQGQDMDHGQTSTNCVIHYQSMPSAPQLNYHSSQHFMSFLIALLHGFQRVAHGRVFTSDLKLCCSQMPRQHKATAYAREIGRLLIVAARSCPQPGRQSYAFNSFESFDP